jgi:DNA-binding transcriptional ArsR family regulator
MSHPGRSGASPHRHDHACVFAALGDRTRLALVAKLCDGQPRSISQLANDSLLSRQAITKHLRVLQHAGLVRSSRAGRENRFQFEPQPMHELGKYLDLISGQWDQSLARLKKLVES